MRRLRFSLKGKGTSPRPPVATLVPLRGRLMPKAVFLFLIRDGTQFAAECPLLAQSGHGLVRCKCPLLGVKRTSCGHVETSANDPKRTPDSSIGR